MPSATFGNRLGAKASPPDHRDYLVANFPRTAVKRPKLFSERAKQTPVKDQGNAGMCVGFAGVAAMEVKDIGEQTLGDIINLSEHWAYTHAKLIDGYPNDEGTDLRSMCNVLLNTGICEEQYEPYTDAHPIVGNPLPGAIEDAVKFKIATYAAVSGSGLRDALWQRGSLMLVLKIYQNFMDIGPGGVVPSPKGALEGLHAVCLTGYEDGRCCAGQYEIKNSWGLAFGDAGYIHIPYKVMPQLFVEARSIVDLDPATVAKLHQG